VHKNVATSYDKFYFDEKYYLSIFHEHKNIKLNHFLLFQKGTNFRVLQISGGSRILIMGVRTKMI